MELSKDLKAASTWCEVSLGQLLLLGDVEWTPTWFCKPGHATVGSTNSAGPSLSLCVLPACFSSTVLSVNVHSCPSRHRELLPRSPPRHSLPSSQRVCVHQALPPLVSTAHQALVHHTLYNLYFGPQVGLPSFTLEPV